MARIVLEGISKEFGQDVMAVDDVSLEIEDGEFMVLVGPSGCGKTTILRIIAGLEEVTAGEVYIDDRQVTDLPAKARDVAMVFQNYALYPHMTVEQNIGFGLKLRHTPRPEIAARVQEAARVLAIEGLLDRKPAALSGGQRQRVAMGRAMVREPKVFLMDEPLSNLDAKLRVQMRAEIARLRDRLRTTTVYVTHDQVEAMTLGDRVAVLRDGLLQQVDTPQRLFGRPANLFVAAFIGSPSMNLVEANLARSNGSGEATFGGFALGIPDEVFAARPALRAFEGRPVILGIRPEDMEDAQLVSDAPSDRRIRSEVLLREALGADVLAHIRVQAPAVMTEDVRELAHDVGAEALEAVEHRVAAGESTFIARLNPRTTARKGTPIELVVDVNRLHFFDPETGLGIYDDTAS
jgi:multiple sugar transport system ATP-binding protein